MLKPQNLQTLHRSLLNAFNAYDFESLLKSRLGLRLELVTTPSSSMSTRMFEVIQTAERAGWTHDLVRAAYEARPNDRDLADIYQDLGLATEVSLQHAGTATNEGPKVSTAEEFIRLFPNRAMDINAWRERLLMIEAQVCRVEVGGGSNMGTGFLVGPDAVLTCYHNVKDVVEARQSPETVRCRFDYRELASGFTEGIIVKLHPTDWLIDFSLYSLTEVSDKPDTAPPTSDELDYVLLRVASSIGMGSLALSTGSMRQRGWIQMPDSNPALVPKMPLIIVSYMNGGPLKLTFDIEGLISLNDNKTRVRYATETGPGSTGAPCFNIDLELVAMHQLRLREPNHVPPLKQGISITAIKDRVRRVGKVEALGGEPASCNDMSIYSRTLDSEPPKPGPILDKEDTQKGRWGGLSFRTGRKVTGKIKNVMRSVFIFDVFVTSTDGSPLQGPVIFHLHDSYSTSVIWVREMRENNEAVLEEISSYGVYTIGIQVKDAQGNWIGLELDLAKLDDLPSRFLER